MCGKIKGNSFTGKHIELEFQSWDLLILYIAVFVTCLVSLCLFALNDASDMKKDSTSCRCFMLGIRREMRQTDCGLSQILSSSLSLDFQTLEEHHKLA